MFEIKSVAINHISLICECMLIVIPVAIAAVYVPFTYWQYAHANRVISSVYYYINYKSTNSEVIMGSTFPHGF